jgi:hypothetical protein
MVRSDMVMLGECWVLVVKDRRGDVYLSVLYTRLDDDGGDTIDSLRHDFGFFTRMWGPTSDRDKISVVSVSEPLKTD